MSVKRAQVEIDSAEFAHWLAFYRLEPWGSEIEDLRAGAGVSMLANINRDVKKRPEPFGPLDFFPWADQRKAGNDSTAEILLEDPKEQAALIRAALYRR
ncbi:DUF4035 domain-containing protein [Burkholderia sp. 22PA0099]|uniref:phage tail assembly protein T n=1 Tax=Burkholderia sp. 22PA0099 TaxID=3237372 RepID=UPI0039C2CD2E